ncbi:MAG: FAD-linked oxidase C-terminal domain-containing protein [Algibacter sp.]
MLLNTDTLSSPLKSLKNQLDGELFYDTLLRTLYSTDASVYQEMPLAVALPKTTRDIKTLIAFAKKHKTSLIPRTAGTSLAGQCVGNGIVVDVSKYFNKILDFNQKEGWVCVQPGVIRDELNQFLKPYGYFFSPITSTANRAMIGGMVGNNSSGSTSIVYGTTREHTLELKTILSDGTEAVFKEIDIIDFNKKRKKQNLEGKIYNHIYNELIKKEIKQNIIDCFPKPTIHRRNTGYAVDYLLKTKPFEKANLFDETPNFNFSKLLCGSEGTLAFTTEIKLHIDPLPKLHDVIVAIHFESITDSMKGTPIVMKHNPTACELIDKTILDCTKGNIEQDKNRYFIKGDPKAVLIVEFRGDTVSEAMDLAEIMIDNLKEQKLGYAYSKIVAPNTQKVWSLRKAGLGLLSNITGDKKAVTCIEDTAVALDDLVDYISDFEKLLTKFNQKSVYYAHAGAGEIHLRPLINLKTKEGLEEFRTISKETAKLVKKYKGSLSGEHGDGRLRGEFIPMMVGEENYQLFRRIKETWDKDNIFNPGKIVDSPAMDTSLRVSSIKPYQEIETIMDFSDTGGILKLAEKCNGAGDCRKLPLSGGTMCPSYMATRDEKDTTRARANTLRTFLTNDTAKNPFNHKEIKDVMDLCLSCKGCTSECPSSVNLSTMKAEFLHQYYKSNGVPFRAKVFAKLNLLNKFGSVFPNITNFILSNGLSSKIIKQTLGVSEKRSLPLLQKVTLRKWYKQNINSLTKEHLFKKKVYLFCDEFTNYNDSSIGIKTIKLLIKLGYKVEMVKHPESGRAAISKGLLSMAQKLAETNISIFSPIISKETPLIGIEPSCILSFRDEYPLLVKDKEKAKALSENVFLIDEFIANEIEKGHISSNQFTKKHKHIMLHGHCHQKALSNIIKTKQMLKLPKNYTVQIIPSGCCGMAGSFGYEKEHYKLSMQIGELVLFPTIRKTDATIVAPGTSCRHQILDGTNRKAEHPIETLFEALT